jgi:hypothetical protein
MSSGCTLYRRALSGAPIAFLLMAAGCGETAPVAPPTTAINAPRSEAPPAPPAKDHQQAAAAPNSGYGPGAELAHQPSANELFTGWARPQVLLLVSGEQNGYIEPCGCAGLENQKGGLARRHSLIKQLAADGWPVVPIDLGNQIRRFGPQQEIKLHTTVEGLKTMGYKAIGYGPDDLRLPVGELIADAANDENGFVSANVGISGFEDVVPKFRIISSGGRKLAVTAVVGHKAWLKVNNDELTYRPAEEALAEVVPQMQEQADLLVLLSHGTPDEAEELARKFADFDIIVTAGGADEPPPEPKHIAGTNAWLVEVGHKGMYVAAIGVYDDARRPFRYQRVSLDKRFPSSPEMHNLLVAYQGQLKDRGLDGLGLVPSEHPSGHKFVGSQTCADCHTKAHEIWSNTPHAHATETLEKLDPPRQYDPECLSCHATGWEPQKFYPYASGFLGLDKTPLLTANGCENCHGPGSAHVAVELGEMQVSQQDQTRLREQMRLPLAAAEARCAACHDLDNSPEFDFKKYWPEVEHRGKD